ncbi:MAG TPA: hypothetical protein VEV83_15850 [Parafilimonas sp.]|jgi:hypothetical protein|nr:hypothetical protein [Parafilimonas sp.]
MTNKVAIFLLVWLPAHSCTQNVQLDKIKAYLNASTVEEKSKYTSDNFRSYFINKEDGGKNKTEALASFQNWDGPMHPDIKILSYTFHDSIWTVTFNEQNDFTKPIGYPGWKGTATFVFDSKGLIRETTYVPDSANLPYKPYLKPAVDWLKVNMPQELDEVYQNGKLVQNAEAANKWRMLLSKWQSQKNN